MNRSLFLFVSSRVYEGMLASFLRGSISFPLPIKKGSILTLPVGFNSIAAE